MHAHAHTTYGSVKVAELIIRKPAIENSLKVPGILAYRHISNTLATH
jgi:hypothetical protein